MATDHTQIDEWIHSTIFQSTKNKNKILDTPLLKFDKKDEIYFFYIIDAIHSSFNSWSFSEI